MKTANPYLNFAGNTEEAFHFYRSVFGGEFMGVIRYREFGGDAMGIPEHDLDKIMHMALPLGPDNILMGTDTLESAGQTLNAGNNFHLNVEAEDEEEAERLFRSLAEDGTVTMPLQAVPWAEKYGSCTDRFGVQWMVNYTGSARFPAGDGAA